MVEQAAVNRKVEGSSPSLGAIFITKCKCTCRSGGIGRRTGLKILRSLPIVPVRPRSPAPIKVQWNITDVYIIMSRGGAVGSSSGS